MGNIRSFKQLRVWQNAMDAAVRVFELTKRFPAGVRYSLTDQFPARITFRSIEHRGGLAQASLSGCFHKQTKRRRRRGG